MSTGPPPDAANPAARFADDPMAVVRHELKTPLTTIQGRVQLAQRLARRLDAPERERLLVHLALIEAAAEALNGRIEGLGDELRPPSGATGSRQGDGAS